MKIAAAIFGLTTLGVIGLQGVASAQTGYPGGTTSNGSSNVAGPNEVVGSSFSGTLCGFEPGSVVTFAVNGTTDAQGTADTNGCVTFTGTVTDPHLAVDGGTPVAVSLGANAITATGTSTNGGTQSDTYTLSVVTSAAAAAAGSGLAFTGADIAAMVAGGLALLGFGALLVGISRRRRLVA